MLSLLKSRLIFGIVVITFLFNFGNMMFRSVLPNYIVEVGATPIQLGMIMALPAINRTITLIPASTLHKKLGKRNLILFSLILSMSSTIFFAFIYDPILFFL